MTKRNSKWKTKLKKFLNFSFYDTNNDIRIRNQKIFSASIKALIIYLLVIIPVFAYTYIVYKNLNLDFYINYRADGQPIWHYLELSNGYLIKTFLIIGYIFFAFSLLMIGMFKPVITGSKIKKFAKHGYLIAIGVVVILTICFFGASQYEYARFYEYYSYSILFENSSNKQEWAKEITDYFIAGKDDKQNSWAWATTTIIIWVMFVQIMLSFTFLVLLQNVVFDQFESDNDPSKYLFMMDQEKENTNLALNTRFWKRWRLFVHNDQRNLAVYTILGSIVVLIAFTVYSILLSAANTNLSALSDWNYRVPYLLNDLTGFTDAQTGLDAYEQIFGSKINSSYYGNLFLISSLQIICLGFTFSILFFFITIFIRSKRVSYKMFFIQIVTLFVFLLLTATVILVSKISMYRLQDLWNTADNSAQLKTKISDALGAGMWDKLLEMFPEQDIFEKGFKIEWLEFYSTIAEGILVYAFIIGLFIIVVIDNQKLLRRTKEAVKWIADKRRGQLKEISAKAKIKTKKNAKKKEAKPDGKPNKKTNKRTTKRNRSKIGK